MNLSGIYKKVMNELVKNEPNNDMKAGYMLAESLVAGVLAEEIYKRIKDEGKTD